MNDLSLVNKSAVKDQLEKLSKQLFDTRGQAIVQMVDGREEYPMAIHVALIIRELEKLLDNIGGDRPVRPKVGLILDK